MTQQSALTLTQKIAQMMVFAGRDQHQAHQLIQDGAGGIWPSGYPDRAGGGDAFRRELAQLQSHAEIGLWVSCDFETGCGQLIADGSCTEFPSLMAFGAIPSPHAEKLAYAAGQIVAEEAAWLGVNITPSPVFDVNTVPENPISNTRSIGDDPSRVASIAVQYALGMASRDTLLPQAKHFPGEGAHYLDPHMGLEAMQVTAQQMQDIHLLPFRAAVANDIPMMMTNHAIYPVFDPDYPCTLSHKLITQLLREKMGFNGLVITDAMEMQGIESRYGRDEALILAVQAGNDLILGPPEPLRFVEIIAAAVERGQIHPDIIERAYQRIMHYKHKLGLLTPSAPPAQITTPKADRQALAVEIAQRSMTLVRNDASILPLNPDKIKNALIVEPSHPHHDFAWGLKFNLCGLAEFLTPLGINHQQAFFDADPDPAAVAAMCEQAAQADVVLVSTFFRSRAGQTGLLTSAQVEMMQQLNQAARQIVFVVSNPYVIAELPFAQTALVTYGNNYTSIQAAVEVIMGRLSAPGQLPVTLPDTLDPQSAVIIAHD